MTEEYVLNEVDTYLIVLILMVGMPALITIILLPFIIFFHALATSDDEQWKASEEYKRRLKEEKEYPGIERYLTKQTHDIVCIIEGWDPQN